MGSEEIKLDLIHWLIETTDTEAVKKIQAIRSSSSSGLTPEQEIILDERMEKYEQGQMNFSSWEDAKARIITKGKNAI